MAVGFPAKTNFATGEVLTATNMNDITGTLNLLQSTLYPAGRNKIINGKFDIWQRGNGTFSTTNSYTADRWLLELSGATAGVTRQSFTVGQTDVPNNPDYFLRLAVTTGDNGCRIVQRIENVSTFATETVTISFYAKGTNPAGGNVEIVCNQNFGSGGSADVATTVGTIVLTASWQKFSKTVTLPSISGKTVGSSNWLSVQIQQPTADTGAAAWTLDLSSVQVENGSTASPFQTASGSITGEQQLCFRYYYVFGYGFTTSSQTTTSQMVNSGWATRMRTSPTLSIFNSAGNFFEPGVGVRSFTISSLSTNVTGNGFVIETTTTSSGVTTVKQVAWLSDNFAASAEL